MINENNKHAWCVNADHAMSANNDGTTAWKSLSDVKIASA